MIITISRQAGTNGALIGRLVAEHLHVKYYDRELVDEIACRLNVDEGVVTKFDETTINIVESLLWEWRASINEEVYARYLRQALQRIERDDGAVIIGRGANFIVSGPETLHVRVMAPLPLRIAMYQAGEEAPEREARRWVRAEDRRRAAFVRKHFNAKIDNPVYYDLVINLERLSVEHAAELIVKGADICRKAPLPAAPEASLPGYANILARRRRPTQPDIVEGEDTRG